MHFKELSYLIMRYPQLCFEPSKCYCHESVNKNNTHNALCNPSEAPWAQKTLRVFFLYLSFLTWHLEGNGLFYEENKCHHWI